MPTSGVRPSPNWYVYRKPGYSRLFIGSDKHDVAELCHAGLESIEEANAHLISAAPDLLAACRLAACGEVWRASVLAQSAINKAEGRTA